MPCRFFSPDVEILRKEGYNSIEMPGGSPYGRKAERIGMRIMTRDRTFYTRLVRLAVPVSLQNLITFAVTFADHLMVSSLGDAAVSGVYIAGQLQTLLQLFSAGVESAILILSSQYWGKGDRDAIRRIVAIGLRISLGFACLVMAACLLAPEPILSIFTDDPEVIACGVTYLRVMCLSWLPFIFTQALIAAMRSVETVRIGMLVSSVSLVANISLNYVLIFGRLGLPALGLRGAAVATLISRAIEMGVMVCYILFADRKLRLRPRDLLAGDRLLRHDLIRYGAPLMVGNLVWSCNTMGNSILMGGFGAGVITAVSVSNTLNTLARVTLDGAQSALGIITGKTIGSGETGKMKEYAYTTQVLFACLGLVTLGLVLLLREPFIALYGGISAEAAAYSRQFITILAFAICGTCYQAGSLYSLVKCGGDIYFVFKLDVFFVFLVVLPSAIVARCLGAEPWIVFLCLKCDQIIKCFVAYVKINSFNWMKDLTRSR